MFENQNKLIYAILLSTAISVYLLVKGGIYSPEWSFYRICDLIKLSAYVKIPDIYLQWFHTSTPLFYYLFYKIHDIPLVHLVAGFIIAVITFTFFYLAVFDVYKNHIVAVCSLLLLFILPLGAASLDLDHAIAFSARSIAYLFAILSIYFFVKEKYSYSSLSLGIASIFQLLNWFPLFVILLIVVIISCLKKSPRKILIYMLPYLAIVGCFFIITNHSALNTQYPITIREWWNFITVLEPDDVTLSWWFTQPSIKLLLFISAIALCLYPVTNRSKAFKDPFWQVLAVSLMLVLLIFIYERYLMFYMPDSLNDYFIPAQVRRILTIPSIMNAILSASLMWNILTDIGNIFIPKMRNKVQITSLISVLVVFLLFFVQNYILSGKLVIKSGDISSNYLTSYFDCNHENYLYFQEAKNGYYYSQEPIDKSYSDLCAWTKRNTPIETGLILPPDMNS